MKAETELELREIQTPKGQEIWKRESQKVLEHAQSLDVRDTESMLIAAELRDAWTARHKALLALLEPACKAADKLHKDLVRDRDEVCEPLDEAARLARHKILRLQDQLEQARRLEQARLEAEAKAKAEEEALELAATLEAAGATQAAEAVVAEPVHVAPVILPPATPKIQGFRRATRKYYATVADRKAFLAAIVEGKICDEAWEPNEQFLNKMANALKEAMGDWPGIEIIWKDI